MPTGKKGLKSLIATLMFVFGLAGPVVAADNDAGNRSGNDTGNSTRKAADYVVNGNWFKRADKDRNKQVTKREADLLATRDFLRLDHNRDGTATVEEIDQRLMERVIRSRERLLKRLDVNRDRTISMSEIAAQTRGLFAHVDTDSNGGITRDEIKSYRQAKRKARQATRRAKRRDRAKTAGQE